MGRSANAKKLVLLVDYSVVLTLTLQTLPLTLSAGILPNLQLSHTSLMQSSMSAHAPKVWHDGR